MLNAVMELIARRFNILRGSINIYDNISENIRIDISYGYSQEEVLRGIYKPGEGVVGTVFKTGKPIVVSSIDDEPLFLNRTGARKKGLSQNSVFICVPVFLDTTVFGTISMEKPNMEKKSCSEELRVLSIVSIIIAHGVNERRSSLKREEDLKNENMLLKIRLSNRQAPGNLVGSSHQMTDLFEKIYLVAPTYQHRPYYREIGTEGDYTTPNIRTPSQGGPYLR
jgi:Nif-specific regulatory protein